MPSDRGLKQAWRVLDGAGHRLNENVEQVFGNWRQALEGVPDDALVAAAEEFVGHFRKLQRIHAPTREAVAFGARNGRGKPFPGVATVARLLPAEVCRKPPTDDDVLDLRWWAPTGGLVTANQWFDWSKYEARLRPHLDRPCRAAWHPTARATLLSLRHWYRWSPDWPNPLELPDVEPLRECGMLCEINTEGPASAGALHYRGLQKHADPYLGCLDLMAWLSERRRGRGIGGR